MENGNFNMGEMNDTESPEGGGVYDDYPMLSIIVPCQIVADSISVLLCLTIILGITFRLLEDKERRKVSSFNLYLVFLTIPDMINSCSHIYGFANMEKFAVAYNPYGVIGTSTDSPEDETNPSQHQRLPNVSNGAATSISNFCIPCVLWINAVILYELLRLLRNSKLRRRCRPPSIRTVIKQAVAVYALCSAWGIAMSFKVLVSTKPRILTMLIVGLAIYFAPVGYMVWVCVEICRKGLLSYNRESSASTSSQCSRGSLIVLVYYLGRLVILNTCMGSVTVVTVIWVISGSPFWFYLYNALYAILIWIGFGLILTKPDVKESVFRIWTCGFCLDQDGNEDIEIRDSFKILDAGTHATKAESESQNRLAETDCEANNQDNGKNEDEEG